MAYDTPVTRLEELAATQPDALHSISPEFPDGLSFDAMLTFMLFLADEFDRDLSSQVPKGGKVVTIARTSVSYFVYLLAVRPPILVVGRTPTDTSIAHQGRLHPGHAFDQSAKRLDRPAHLARRGQGRGRGSSNGSSRAGRSDLVRPRASAQARTYREALGLGALSPPNEEGPDPPGHPLLWHDRTA